MNGTAAGKRPVRILAAAALCLFLVLLVSCGEKIVPKVFSSSSEEARIDVSNWSFKDDGPMRLIGNTWEMYWNELYTPGDFFDGAVGTPPSLVTGGSAWNGMVINGEKLTENGFATYRTVILLPEAGRIYSFYIKNQDSAYRLWINGELLAENGVVAETEEEYLPRRLPRLFHYHARGGELEIIIQIANFTHKWGGLTNNIFIGLPAQLRSFINGRYGTITFLTGAILMMALYHLFLFMNRRKDAASLFFFLFCLSAFVWYLFRGDYLFFRFFPAFPLGAGIRLEYFSLYGVMPFFFLFIWRVYSGSIRRVFVIVPAAAGSCFMLLVVVTPLKFFSAHTLVPFYALVVIAFGILLTLVMRAALRKRPGAVLSLLGCLAFFTTALYDIAANRKIIMGNSLSPFLPAGLFIFILFQSFILAKRFSRAYDDLDDLANTLEQQVARRTEELQNTREKLFEREKLAALGTLAGGISHEIFNPLSGISGPLGVLRRELTVSGPAKNETITKHLDYMEAKVEEISAVVKNLNNLIHEKEIQKVPVPLLPLVERVAADYSKRNKAVHFSIGIGKDDIVSGDPGVLRQIIDNLVSNAAAAVESGGRVAVRFETTDTGSRIVVEDNGRGMGLEEAARAGNPFFTTKETSGGSGMGLFLVKRFAASLGWEVHIDSRVGEGTRVTLSLPLSG
jgi:signal transduction histidine kinase